MGLWSKLLGREPRDPESECRKLAKLLVTEVRLYNARRLEQLAADGADDPWFREELAKSYATYHQRCGGYESAREIFVSEAASALVNGREKLVRDALDGI